MKPPACRVVVWNIEWRRRDGVAGQELRRRIDLEDADIICITEGHEDFLPSDGNIITSAIDYGYPIKAGRRKVLLWSRRAWREIDELGDELLPPGRFIAGTTNSPLGDVRVVGVCIPWSAAHVASGRRDRKRWEDHVAFLKGLRRIGERDSFPPQTIVVGDYNQTIPRTTAPLEVYGTLMSALQTRLCVATSGKLPAVDRRAIDHLAHTKDLEAVAVRGLCNKGTDGLQLSDHFGLSVDLTKPS